MSADLTPRAVPAIDRRRGDQHPEAIPMHPEAASDAIEQARLVMAAGQGLANAAVMAGVAFARKLKQVALRGACYPLANGERLRGVHPGDVQAGLAELVRWGGCEGPNAEDAFARALAAADASRATRAVKQATTPHHRRVREKIDADLETARERARVHVTVSSSRR